MLTSTSRSPRSRATAATVAVRLQIGRGHAHAEVQTAAAFQGSRDVFDSGEVADDDLGSGRAKCLGTVVVGPDERPDGSVASAEDLDDLPVHAAGARRGPCHKKLLYLLS